MEWQAVVLALQILLLAIGWVLFQRARGELSARAAETPVLGEVKSLHKSIKQLLGELETRANKTADRLELGCDEARIAVHELEATLKLAEEIRERLEAANDLQIRRNDPDIEMAANVPLMLRPLSFEASKPLPPPRERTHSLKMTEGFDGPQHNNGSSKDVPQKPHESKRRLVFAMADAGEGPPAIARAAQLSEGEVETLLGLRSQRR